MISNLFLSTKRTKSGRWPCCPGSGLNSQWDYFVYFCAVDLWCVQFHINGDGNAVSLTAYIRSAQVDAIQTIDSDESTTLMWFQRHRSAIAAHSRRRVYRHDTLSMVFTKIDVQKSVSVRRLLGLDHFTWTLINQLGILGRIHPR